jgi:hypothetical protein
VLSTRRSFEPSSQVHVMSEIEERLLPRDGLNNYNVFLARLELEPQGNAQFTFSLTHSMMPIGELVVPVVFHGQSLDRMAIEAHDGVLDILRQLMFRADKARTNHLKLVEPPIVADEDEVRLDTGEPEETR